MATTSEYMQLILTPSSNVIVILKEICFHCGSPENLTSMLFSSFPYPYFLAEHGIVVEYFRDIPGVEVEKLTSNPKYPKTPDEVQKIQVFETPQERGNHYGARLRTYFMVRLQLF